MAPGALTETASQDFFSGTVQKANLPSRRIQQWPKSFTNALAWDASTFKSMQDYTIEVTQSENKEIASALADFLDLALDGHEINTDNFRLPTLGGKLRQWAVEVHSGRGFVNIRDVELDRYSPEDSVIIFLGLSSYIGEKRAKQDDQGSMLMHICNAHSSPISQENRPTRFSNRASTFHTDPFPDILGLHTRSCAARGGNHILSSSLSIYNTLAATRPDLLEVLAQPDWPFDSPPGGLIERTMRPILFYHGGHIIFNYAREPLLGLYNVPRSSGFPSLTAIQLEALDLLERTAKANQVVLRNRPGDLTFLNNHGLLHSREAFEDEAGSNRYLVRLWLRNERLAWKLPRVLQDGNRRLYEENEVDGRWNIMPLPRLTFTVAERLCS